MASGRDLTTEADVDAAYERARNAPPMPHATIAEYHAATDTVVVHIDSGEALTIPRSELQGLEAGGPVEWAHIEIFGGLDIAWPALDVDHYLPYLMEGRYATERWKNERLKQTAAA